MKRTAIYARFSSTSQSDGCSIETQLEHCRKIAGPNPLEFIDRAQTGRTQFRTAFMEMLSRADEFDTLVVYTWSRFGRNAETHATIADLEDAGVKVISATEGADFLARGVGLLVSQDMSMKLGLRVKDAMRVRFKQFHSHLGGSVSLGYRLEKSADGLNRLVVDEAESAMIKSVFHWYLTESIGAKRLAKRLDEKGYKTRKGGNWSWTTINRILRNPIYTGVQVYGRSSEKLDRRTGKKKRIVHDQANHLIHHDEALRIISDKDYAAVQAKLKCKVHRDYRIPTDIRVFSKRVFCGCCGNAMFTRHQGLQRKNKIYFLVCGRRDKYGAKDPQGCTNPNRPSENNMIAWVQDGIRKVMDRKDQIIKRAIELAEKQLNTNDARREGMEAELKQVMVSIERYRKMLKSVKNDDAELGLLSQIGVLEKERDNINALMQKLASEASFDRRVLIREIEQAFNECQQNILLATDPAVVNGAIDRFCGQIVALPDGTVVRRADFAGAVPERPTAKGVKPARLLPAPDSSAPHGYNTRPPEMTVTPAPPSSAPKRSACSRP